MSGSEVVSLIGVIASLAWVIFWSVILGTLIERRRNWKGQS